MGKYVRTNIVVYKPLGSDKFLKAYKILGNVRFLRGAEITYFGSIKFLRADITYDELLSGVKTGKILFVARGYWVDFESNRLYHLRRYNSCTGLWYEISRNNGDL